MLHLLTTTIDSSSSTEINSIIRTGSRVAEVSIEAGKIEVASPEAELVATVGIG